MNLKKSDIKKTQQIIALMMLVLSRNYFTFQKKIYQPEKKVYLLSSKIEKAH